MIIAAMALALTAMTPPPPAGGGNPASGTSSLSAPQQDAVAAMHLGLSPGCLAAAGYTAAETGAVMIEVRQDGVFSQIRLRWAAACVAGPRPHPFAGASGQTTGATPSPAPAMPAAVERETVRVRVITAGIAGESPARLVRLKRCIESVAVGIPAELGVACRSTGERSRVAGALVAERRAARLGRAIGGRDAGTLAAVRADPEAVAAALATTQRLASIRARVMGSTPSGQP